MIDLQAECELIPLSLNEVKENIPHEKPMRSFPAYLIGRLGVSSDYNGYGIGSPFKNKILVLRYDIFEK